MAAGANGFCSRGRQSAPFEARATKKMFAPTDVGGYENAVVVDVSPR